MNDKPPPDFAWPLRVAVGIAFAVVVAVTLAQVVMRYFFDAPLMWSEELAKLLIVWITFIGAAVICWDGRHLHVDVVFVKLPKRLQAAVRLFNLVVSIAFLAILSYWSIRLVRIENMQTLTALPLPAGVVRLAATIGGALMIVAILGRYFYRRPRHRAGDPAYGIEDPM
ncbi:TRAP transporter small permease [Fodinicurvata sp. EGI_FJ10296]|uniref:TRAP transporter small permease n=1 Tax=Fodinicurvata sp. EGI_FJ10296 TaxID=3231908 RepID=UPI0034534DE8